MLIQDNHTLSNQEDFYQKNFLDAKNALQQCQVKNGFTSCLGCGEFFSCAIRESYVSATYESMSKGQDGAFDFN